MGRVSWEELAAFWLKFKYFLVQVRNVVRNQLVLFMATDSDKVWPHAEKHGIKFWRNPGTTVHMSQAGRGATETQLMKTMADWYYLALADFLLSPSNSGYSRTASLLGMQISHLGSLSV